VRQFDASEIFQLAIRIEENGEKYYRHMSKVLKDTKVKDLFNYLADEEVKHKKLFELMVSKIEKYEPVESYPKEYFAYIRALADDVIFNERKLDEDLKKIEDAVSAIDFAKEKESNSILYYQGVRNLVPENQRNSINSIIDEERSHFTELSNLKKLLV
jgi:rubrerythrin